MKENGNTGADLSGIDKTLFINYLLNEIRSLEDSAKQLVSVNSVLIGIYIAFMANSLIIDAIRTFLIFAPYPKYSVYIVLVPIFSWFASVIYCSRVLNPKIETSDALFDEDKSANYLKAITKSKHDLLKLSYFFLGFGLIVIVIIAAFAIPYQLTGIAETWKNNGDDLYDQDKYNESMQAYDKAIEINPQYAEAWCNRAKVLFDQGKLNDAILNFNKAIEINPQYADALYGRTQVLARLNKDSLHVFYIDKNAFPRIKVYVFTDKFCARSGQLSKDEFKVNEDGNNVAIDDFYFTDKAPGQKLDLAVVFDSTGSMQPAIVAMKSEVKNFTDAITASGMDASYALVSFNDRVSVMTKWTNDPTVFKRNVDALYAKGGADELEASMDAIEAVLSMGFRPNAQKVILIITDSAAHYKDDGSKFSKYTEEQVKKDLLRSGATFIAVSPMLGNQSTGVDMRRIAMDMQGTWISMKNPADFSIILEQLTEMITRNYVIEFTSPNQMTFWKRNVTVSVDASGCLAGMDLKSYNRPEKAN